MLNILSSLKKPTICLCLTVLCTVVNLALLVLFAMLLGRE